MELPRLTVSLADWIAQAAWRDQVIVQTSPHNSNDEVIRAREAGLITTAQRRAEGHAFDLIAIRTKATRPDKAPIGRGQVCGLDRPHKTKGPKPATIAKMRLAVEYRQAGLTLDQIGAKMGTTGNVAKKLIGKARMEGML